MLASTTVDFFEVFGFFIYDNSYGGGKTQLKTIFEIF